MIGHNQIKAAVAEIKEHHFALQELMSKAGDRAASIGRILLELQPSLKSSGMSISDLCEELPFGKSTAYEYMAIAKGTKTWSELNERKNPVRNSASAENVLIFGYMPFEIGLAHLRAMMWVNDGSEYDNWIENKHRSRPEHLAFLDRTISNSGLPVTRRDVEYAAMAIADANADGKNVLQKDELVDDRSIIIAAIEYACKAYDTYFQGFNVAMAILHADDERADLISEGKVKEAQSLLFKQEEHSKLLGISLEECRMLCALLLNQKANVHCLKQGGIYSEHPLWEGYLQLLPRSLAEEWCCEAMFETALCMLEVQVDDQEGVTELIELKRRRSPFWLLASKAAEILNSSN